MKLQLSEEKDLFLLFVLAVVWSRTGPWENAAFFIAYLKYKGFDKVQDWSNTEFVDERLKEKDIASKEVLQLCRDATSRTRISFRKDIYHSIYVLANKWDEIRECLNQSEEQNNYEAFVTYMRGIKGLGVNSRCMNIKILLILRELRCQNIKRNIPGEYCCVPDKRVVDACKELKIKLPTSISSVKQLLNASSILYRNFHELYDIPAFAYEDLKKSLIE